MKNVSLSYVARFSAPLSREKRLVFIEAFHPEAMPNTHVDNRETVATPVVLEGEAKEVYRETQDRLEALKSIGITLPGSSAYETSESLEAEREELKLANEQAVSKAVYKRLAQTSVAQGLWNPDIVRDWGYDPNQANDIDGDGDNDVLDAVNFVNGAVDGSIPIRPEYIDEVMEGFDLESYGFDTSAVSVTNPNQNAGELRVDVNKYGLRETYSFPVTGIFTHESIVLMVEAAEGMHFIDTFPDPQDGSNEKPVFDGASLSFFFYGTYVPIQGLIGRDQGMQSIKSDLSNLLWNNDPGGNYDEREDSQINVLDSMPFGEDFEGRFN